MRMRYIFDTFLYIVESYTDDRGKKGGLWENHFHISNFPWKMDMLEVYFWYIVESNTDEGEKWGAGGGGVVGK